MRNTIIKKELERQRFSLPFHIMRPESSQTGQGDIRQQDENSDNKGNLIQDQGHSGSIVKLNSLKEQTTTTTIEENPYYDKYAEKIKAAKAKAGVAAAAGKDVHDSNHVVSNYEEKVNVNLMNQLEKSFESSTGQEKSVKSISKRISLNEIVHLDKIKNLSPHEIEQVWRSHHATQKDIIYATLKSTEYEIIYENASKYPLFIFPLPRSTSETKDGLESQEGYQMFLSKFTQHTFYLTPLEQYKKMQESAVPNLVINHYPELSSTKQIVLMNGTFDSSLLNAIEVQCLANQIKLFYSTNDQSRLMLLHKFNREPSKFDHLEVIEQIEKSISNL